SRRHVRVSICSIVSNIAERYLKKKCATKRHKNRFCDLCAFLWLIKSNGSETCSRQMAVRGDHRPRALWRGHGLQRVSRDGAKRERQSVLLRDQAGRLGCDRIRRDVAGDAV